MLNLVAASVGVAASPAQPWRAGAHPKLVARPLVRPRLSAEIAIIRLRERELSPVAADFLALARERLRILVADKNRQRSMLSD